MLQVLVVLADKLDDLLLRCKFPRHVYVPGLLKHARILNRYVSLEMREIDALVFLDDVQLLCPRIAIHPSTIVEANCIDNKDVSFPPTDGMAHPGWILILRMLAAVQENLPKTGSVLKKDDE